MPSGEKGAENLSLLVHGGAAAAHAPDAQDRVPADVADGVLFHAVQTPYARFRLMEEHGDGLRGNGRDVRGL